MTEQAEQLMAYIRKIIDDYQAEIEIAPAFIAREVIKEIDPSDSSPILVSFSANMAIRQMARQELRKTFDPIDKDNPQAEMFGGLQDRYPVKRGDQSAYALLNTLTDDEIDFNAQRLYAEGEAKIKHADALVAFKMSKTG